MRGSLFKPGAEGGKGGEIERTLVSEPDADAVFRSATLNIDGR